MPHPRFDFSDLSPEERVQLAEDRPANLSLTEAQARDIDQRLAAYRQDGDPGQPWEAVLDRIEQRLEERGG